MKFNENGKFKILAIADSQDTDQPQKESIDMLCNALDTVKPDLVVLLGDNIAGNWLGVTVQKTRAAIAALAQPIESRGIPFALVFGNHDHEGLTNKQNGMTEKEAKMLQMQMYNEYKHCIAVAGEEMTGCGNYNLLIRDSKNEKPVFNLWMMDSNAYAAEGGYGYVQPDQTEWYIKTSNELKAQNGGVPLPSLLFQHVIVPEAYKLFDAHSYWVPGSVKGHSTYSKSFYSASDRVVQGELLEAPCCADVAHGQFASWKQQGDIIGAFFGHDHNNTFSGQADSIWLTAVPASGYHSYGYNHGVRVIELDENDLSTFKSDILLSADLLDYEVKPRYKANHGYAEYISRYVPMVWGSIGVGVLAVGITAAIGIHIHKKRKRNMGK